MVEKPIGKVSHWFGKIGVAALELTDTIAVGDRIHILGYTTDFEQEVTSMQIMHQDVDKAGPGDEVAIKAQSQVRVGDSVYKVT